MGYVLDGKNRIIVVKDSKDGKSENFPIQSRAMIHILLDTKGNPTLFLNTLYVSDYRHYSAIVEAAKYKARRTGLPLVTYPYVVEDEVDYEQFLYFLSGPIPTNMCDMIALGNVLPQKNGIFTIVSELKAVKC